MILADGYSVYVLRSVWVSMCDGVEVVGKRLCAAAERGYESPIDKKSKEEWNNGNLDGSNRTLFYSGMSPAVVTTVSHMISYPITT